MDIGQGLASFGNSMAGVMGQYHKEHQAYDQQAQLAEALSRLGINEQGQITQINPEVKDKSIKPIIDPKALQMFQAKNHEGQVKATGALEALNKMAIHGLAPIVGQIGQERLKAAQLENQRYQTQIGDENLPLTAGQKANVLVEQQRSSQAPAGKQFWEGDDESPPGYYTPNQISSIRNRKQGQQAKGAYQDLKTQIGLTKDKTSALTKELSDYSQSYGFPPTLFESKTKVYEEGSKIGKREIPKGYYGVEVTNPKTGDINVLNVGKEEFKKGQSLYEKLQEQRKNIDNLGGKVQTETSKAKAMLDWAARNPGAPGSAQAKAKAQAILSELAETINQPAATPSPAPEERMNEAPPVDLDEFLGQDWKSVDLPDKQPKLTTFYYPATPEETRAKGLSYSMEGGVQGGAGFSDVDLRNHTLEKFLGGESDFVAVAMKGRPTGELFRTVVNGTPIIGKNVDTGGGLRPGQMDIATSNPQLAKTGVERSGDIGEGIRSKIDAVPTPAMFAGEPTDSSVESATEYEPPPIDLKEFLGAEPSQTPAPTAAPTPMPAPTMGAANVEPPPFDLNEFIGGSTDQPFVASTQEIPPTPLPTPDTTEGSAMGNAVSAAGEFLGGMMPNSIEDYAASVFPPLAAYKQGKALATGDVSSVPFVGRVPEIMEADKTPAFSKQRYHAAANTLMDVGMLAGGVPKGKPYIKAEPIASAAGKQASIFNTPKVILNKVFGEGIGDRLQAAETHATAIAGRHTSMLDKAGFTKLNKFELENLRSVAQGTDVPMNPRVAKVAEAWDTIRREDATDYVSKGAKIMDTPTVRDPMTGLVLRKSGYRDFTPRKNYVPEYVDPNKVANAPATFADDIRNVNQGMTQQTADEVAAYLRAEARGEGGLRMSDPDLLGIVKGANYVPTHLHARGAIKLPEYVYQNLRESIPKYLAESSNERGYLEAFGPEFDNVIQDAVTNLGPRRGNVKLASEVWDDYRGRKIESESGTRIKQTANTLNNLATTSLLGIPTAISQFSQMGVIASRLPLRRLAVGMIKAVTRDGRLRAQEAGSFVNALVDDYSIVTKTSPVAGKLKKVEKASAYLASKAVKFGGIEAMDKFPRVVAFHAAEAELKQAQRAAVRGNRRAQRTLDEAKLTATSTDTEVAEAAANISKKYNLSVRFSDLPYVLQTPMGSFARGLNTFNVQMSRLLWKDFVRPAMSGKPGPLLKLLTAQILIGEGIGETRRWLTGRGGDRPGGSLPEFIDDVMHGRKTTMGVAKRALDDLSWSGTLGFAQNIYQALAWSASGTESASRLFGTLSGAGISNALETLAGAGYEFGMAGAAAVRPTETMKEDEQARQELERRLKTGARILTRRIPVIGGIAAPQIFRSEKTDRRMAASAIKRAKERGDPYAAMEWRNWFKERHPESRISQSAVANAED